MDNIIYKLTSPSGKIYIGRTKDYHTRMQQHESRHDKGKENKVLYDAIKKYGWDNFKKEIIARVDSKVAPDVEHMMMIKYDSVKNGYNMTYSTNGGDVWEGRRDTQEYLDYIEKTRSNSMGIKNGFYGKTHTKYARKKMSHSGEKNPMHGKKHSKSAIQKQKEKAKGRFSLPWYIDRHGTDEGTRLYEERRQWLKTRNLPKDKNGKFISKKS